MVNTAKSVALRAQFGKNLRLLCADHPSVSEVCRQLNINRAQFNRYLNGESYPRPDMLVRICEFFNTDARILTDTLDSISAPTSNLVTHPEISAFTALEQTRVSEEDFPSGFYRLSRQSFLFPERYITALLFIYRKDGWTFLKGSEAPQSLKAQGMPMTPEVRQFRGYVQKIEGGIAAMVSRRNALTFTFNYISPVASFDRNFWQGYSTRTVNEAINNKRITRIVYEHLGRSTKPILQTARNAGFCEFDELPSYHQRLLRVDEPFS